MMMATPTRSRAVTRSPRTAAAMATPRKRVEEVEGRGSGGADAAHEDEPDHRRRHPRHQGRVDEGREEPRRDGDLPGLHGEAYGEERDRPYQHLQPDDDPEVPAGGGVAERQRGDRERQHADDAGGHPAPVQAVAQPAGHDDENACKPGEKARERDGRQALAEEDSAERGDAERHRAGDDRGEARLDGAHGEMEEPEIKRVLADAEDDDRAPFAGAQPDALAGGETDAERDQTRAEKTRREHEERRPVLHHDPRRGEGRAPDRGERETQAERAEIEATRHDPSSPSARAS